MWEPPLALERAVGAERTFVLPPRLTRVDDEPSVTIDDEAVLTHPKRRLRHEPSLGRSPDGVTAAVRTEVRSSLDESAATSLRSPPPSQVARSLHVARESSETTGWLSPVTVAWNSRMPAARASSVSASASADPILRPGVRRRLRTRPLPLDPVGRTVLPRPAGDRPGRTRPGRGDLRRRGRGRRTRTPTVGAWDRRSAAAATRRSTSRTRRPPSRYRRFAAAER